MFKLLIRGIRAHIVRFLLTGLAIILGITFLVGSFVITDTIRVSFDDLFTQLTKGTDAVVQGPLTAGSVSNPDEQEKRDPIPASILAVVRQLPGVADAEGNIQTNSEQPIALISADGKPIGGKTAPQFGYGWLRNPDFSPWRIAIGRAPTADNEIVIDAQSARDGKLNLGAQVLVNAPPDNARRYNLVGIARFGRVDRPIGATGALFTMSEIQRITRLPAQFREIYVHAKSGVSSNAIRAQIAGALRVSNANVLTGNQYRQQQQNQIRKVLKFVYIGLFVFGGIGLLVGGFIIFNTFTVILAQRTRELALLRAIGAAPVQVVLSVLGEAVVVGLLASALGVLGGIGLAISLRAVLDALDLALPAGDLVVQLRTVGFGMAVGTIVTMIAALVPALRTARIRPIAALRESAVEQPLPRRSRGLIGGFVMSAGIAAVFVGLFTKVDNSVLLAAAGAVVAFTGVFIISPLLVPPAARILGFVPSRTRGMAGRLARDNAYRNPRRSAWTAIALTLGVAIVGLVTIVTASFKQTIAAALDNQLGTTDYFIAGTLSPDITARVSHVPGVKAAMGISFVEPTIQLADNTRPNDARLVLAIDPKQLQTFVNLGAIDGDLANLANNGIAVPRSFANRHHVHVGSQLYARFPKAQLQLTIAVIFEKRVFDRPALLIDHALYNRVAALPFDIFSVAIAEPGVDTAKGTEAIKKELHDYPTAVVKDFAQFKADQEKQIDQALFLFYGLLLLAIVIALIGIVNTLALSVHERTHEIGLLRAVGTSRKQIRTTIRWESVIISVFGTLLGLAIGIVFGAIFVMSLRTQNLVTKLDFALPRLAVIAVIAGLAGVIAAVLPARRAANLNVLDAIRTE